MAIIHETTMRPGKLELLAGWLPGQPWYQRTQGTPQLNRAGGFRLDDPAGEVGIEFMVVTDTTGDRTEAYQLPLTYRGAPLPGQDSGGALIGTSEHGVLGRRYVYDGVRDPVLVNQLVALLNGQVQAQAQRLSDTPDRSVTAHLAGPALHVVRVLAAGDWEAAIDLPGYVRAQWTRPDGTPVQGLFATVRE